MLLSLVIPCYNEEGNVKRFFDETNRVFSGKVENYEFVFVDDGSGDKTYPELKKLREGSEHRVQVLSFSRNFGKEAAIYAGLSASKGDLVCIIDADLQQRPEVVLEMLDEMEKDSDIDCVTAFQEKRKENAAVGALKSAFYKLINNISEVDFVNGASDFRLMKRNTVDAVLSMTEYHRFSKGIFSWVGFNTKYIPYTAEERESGETKWGFKKLLKYALEGIFAFSTAPLKLSVFCGIVSVIAALILLILSLFRGFTGVAIIVVLLLFVGGIQLICLGILGEYLSKIYGQVKNRPIYILKEHLKNDEETD